MLKTITRWLKLAPVKDEALPAAIAVNHLGYLTLPSLLKNINPNREIEVGIYQRTVGNDSSILSTLTFLIVVQKESESTIRYCRFRLTEVTLLKGQIISQTGIPPEEQDKVAARTISWLNEQGFAARHATNLDLVELSLRDLPFYTPD